MDVMDWADVGWDRRGDGTPVRVIRNRRTSQTWRVRVADTRRQPGARGDRCLIFDTCDFVRRVWRVPDDWDRMSPEALVALAETGVGGAEHERVPSWRPLSLDWRPSEW
jgi:hypothetical protein